MNEIDPAQFTGFAPARDPLLVKREKTHGDFKENARIVFGLYAACPYPSSMTKAQQLAMNMIYLKIARVLSNPKTKDSWDDIAGYAKLGAEACE